MRVRLYGANCKSDLEFWSSQGLANVTVMPHGYNYCYQFSDMAEEMSQIDLKVDDWYMSRDLDEFSSPVGGTAGLPAFLAAALHEGYRIITTTEIDRISPRGLVPVVWHDNQTQRTSVFQQFSHCCAGLETGVRGKPPGRQLVADLTERLLSKMFAAHVSVIPLTGGFHEPHDYPRHFGCGPHPLRDLVAEYPHFQRLQKQLDSKWKTLGVGPSHTRTDMAVYAREVLRHELLLGHFKWTSDQLQTVNAHIATDHQSHGYSNLQMTLRNWNVSTIMRRFHCKPCFHKNTPRANSWPRFCDDYRLAAANSLPRTSTRKQRPTWSKAGTPTFVQHNYASFNFGVVGDVTPTVNRFFLFVTTYCGAPEALVKHFLLHHLHELKVDPQHMFVIVYGRDCPEHGQLWKDHGAIHVESAPHLLSRCKQAADLYQMLNNCHLTAHDWWAQRDVTEFTVPPPNNMTLLQLANVLAHHNVTVLTTTTVERLSTETLLAPVVWQTTAGNQPIHTQFQLCCNATHKTTCGTRGPDWRQPKLYATHSSVLSDTGDARLVWGGHPSSSCVPTMDFLRLTEKFQQPAPRNMAFVADLVHHYRWTTGLLETTHMQPDDKSLQQEVSCLKRWVRNNKWRATNQALAQCQRCTFVPDWQAIADPWFYRPMWFGPEQ
eukprot:TRINITY_DN84224_c0_g1_i1.p1 TRINITY_DN84224_c0_g1~~TRINITY_DN84224_c0_g1_i1.p1  ORF type:complete len:768 (-),score=52.69 TRINITY_DN84224_c0_g1_i1:45-2021(-)